MKCFLPVTAVCLLAAGHTTAWGQCEIQKLVASDGGMYDKFGWSIAIGKDMVVVGAPLHDGVDFNAGSAYIYRRDGSKWVEDTILYALDGDMGDGFGGSVAVRGDVMIVSASGVDGRPPAQNLGAAYVYRFITDTWRWVEDATLTASDGSHMDHFARSVAISGDVAIASSHADDDNGTGSGSAYIFRYDPNTSGWAQETKLLASDGAEEDHFGISVAMSGDVILIGAYADADNGMYSGSAYVFRYDPDTSAWIEEAKLLASDGAALDWFGTSVAISGDHLIVGAAEFYSGRPGKAYIYH
ncbi:MAG: FG-GAP repeat protein [Planctomycetes bacterium]|nr:FG-GAP repeat protein [Planctomycetota bacterium]